MTNTDKQQAKIPKDNTNPIVIPADKGNSSVIMD